MEAFFLFLKHRTIRFIALKIKLKLLNQIYFVSGLSEFRKIYRELHAV